MNELDDAKVNVDKRGRICDKQGRPLREHSIRNYRGPFMGRDGKPHPRLPRLEARQQAFNDLRPEWRAARRLPGSLKK